MAGNHSSIDKTNSNNDPLEAIVDEAIDSADNGKTTLKDLLEAWGDRSYGPFFIVLGLFAGTPLAVVPFAAAVVGVIISLLAIQMVFGRTHAWLPGFMLDWSVDEEKLKAAREKAAPTLKLFDHLITERLTFAANSVIRWVAAIVVVALGLLMVPLDMVPMAVAAPAWAVVLFGVAITARDGLVMMLALAATAGIAVLAFRLL